MGASQYSHYWTYKKRKEFPFELTRVKGFLSISGNSGCSQDGYSLSLRDTDKLTDRHTVSHCVCLMLNTPYSPAPTIPPTPPPRLMLMQLAEQKVTVSFHLPSLLRESANSSSPVRRLPISQKAQPRARCIKF